MTVQKCEQHKPLRVGDFSINCDQCVIRLGQLMSLQDTGETTTPIIDAAFLAMLRTIQTQLGMSAKYIISEQDIGYMVKMIQTLKRGEKI